MTNGYWLLEETTPKRLDDKLQQILTFGDRTYCHSRLQIIKDEPDEVSEQEIGDEIERTIAVRAVRTLVQADFTAQEIAFLESIGFIKLGEYQFGFATQAVYQRMRNDAALWLPNKPNRPPPFERRERRPLPPPPEPPIIVEFPPPPEPPIIPEPPIPETPGGGQGINPDSQGNEGRGL